ncbi:hypothetical protein [Tsukamurella tyrosinosolvens]|uniref:hypothetical protein n=1 Tax=Tsukamurella tyrosinosolvens TaxID=57704 RepID=UPI000C7F1541|nr:hypothetical protein [Tsukamurella tyrosinosolvens]AUN42564.1 hypothetical protein ASU32_23155 [Tsukamurella tyrosinosolvens]
MILNDDQRRVLTFIREVNDGGFSPSGEDVTEWFERPDVLPGKVTVEIVEFPWEQLSKAAMRNNVKSPFAAFTEQMAGVSKIAETMNSMTSQFKWLTDPPAMPEIARPDFARALSQPRTRTRREPDETLIEQLTRLRWITTNSTGTGLRLTDLGKALLRSDQQRSSDDNVLVLHDDGPLAWASLLAEIGDAGNCTIVDPYLRAPELARFIEFSSIKRVIVGPNLKEKGLLPLRVLLRDLPPDQDVEVRVGSNDHLHDRFIVGERAVYSLGVSGDNIGKKLSTLKEMSAEIADTIREAVEKWWDAATPLVASEDQSVAAADHEQTGDDE